MTAKIVTKTKLNLSIGATCEALPNCKALKYATHDAPVAKPDKIKNSQFFPVKLLNGCHFFVYDKNATNAIIITIVRINVAKSELMPCKPTFAKIAVNAAKTADAAAQ